MTAGIGLACSSRRGSLGFIVRQRCYYHVIPAERFVLAGPDGSHSGPDGSHSGRLVWLEPLQLSFVGAMDPWDRFLLGYLLYRDFSRRDPPRREISRRRGQRRRYRAVGPSFAEILFQFAVYLLVRGFVGVYDIIKILVKAKVAMKMARYRRFLH